MLPKSLEAELDAKTWQVPPALSWLKKAANIESSEFQRTWNTGLGMVLVVAPEKRDEATRVLTEFGETVYTIGQLRKRLGEGCTVKNMDTWD
jgi:phosphoribosylaminoimidazole (AIR) synthetase